MKSVILVLATLIAGCAVPPTRVVCVDDSGKIAYTGYKIQTNLLCVLE